MQRLGVDDHLATLVVDDQHPDGSPAGIEGLLEAVVEVGLVKHWQGLLDITGLGHGNNFRYSQPPDQTNTNWGLGELTTSVLEVKDAVLLQDRSAHGLDNNAWGGVVNGRGLLMELLGEEVDSEVAVLAGGGGGGDPDDLGNPALEDQDVADSDVVAGNGN